MISAKSTISQNIIKIFVSVEKIKISRIHNFVYNTTMIS